MVFCEGLSILKSLYDSYNSLDKKMELLNNFRIVINNDVSNASFNGIYSDIINFLAYAYIDIINEEWWNTLNNRIVINDINDYKKELFISAVNNFKLKYNLKSLNEL
jgi:hypothetical protein